MSKLQDSKLDEITEKLRNGLWPKHKGSYAPFELTRTRIIREHFVSFAKELRRDSERLDFLDKCRKGEIEAPDEYPEGVDFRQAIDQAIRKERV